MAKSDPTSWFFECSGNLSPGKSTPALSVQIGPGMPGQRTQGQGHVHGDKMQSTKALKGNLIWGHQSYGHHLKKKGLAAEPSRHALGTLRQAPNFFDHCFGTHITANGRHIRGTFVKVKHVLVVVNGN